VRRRPVLVLTAASAILGFLLVTAVSSVGQARRADEPRKAELIDLIEQRRDLVAEQDRVVSALRDDVDAARRESARRSRQDRAEGEAVAELAMQAGTVAVRGRGLEVKLSDSARRSTTGEDADAFRIHDTDLQLVVNALFAAGAEAVSVNGSRLVATTPIRAAGDTIVVNFRPLTPPYRVAAIGADRRAFEASEIARRFRRWTGLFGLGFDVSQREVDVPAYSGRVAIVTARPR
jgi:uncharacterized protein YlxW (UPF0749 family)